MTKVEYRLKLGQDEFTLIVDVDSSLDFFEKLSFYSNLPKTGPSGEDDLKITHRTTSQGYNYYSLVSEKAGMEYKFGQPKEAPKSLYGKGWEPIFRGEGDGAQQSQAVPRIGQAPVNTQQFTPPPQPIPQVQQPVPTPQAFVPPTAQQPAATSNPQVAQVANNVLARFGIPAK